MSASIALVTDSTATLPAEVCERRGITVVPLQVVIGDESLPEGEDTRGDFRGVDEGGSGERRATPAAVSAALRAHISVSTSRPTPAAMLEAYEKVAAEGASGIVSVHLSGAMSATFESAQLAARNSPVPVLAVDTRQLGMGTGFAVLAAADVLDSGGTAEQAADVARERAAATTCLFYVDTLEYLRRGGRIGAAAAFLGSALSVKPLLRLDDGKVASLEKVRTSARALARLEELSVEVADDQDVDVAVEHLDQPERAVQLAQTLGRRLEDNLGGREIRVCEVGAVIGAHVGPGMLAVVVAPRVAGGTTMLQA